MKNFLFYPLRKTKWEIIHARVDIIGAKFAKLFQTHLSRYRV